MLIISLPPQRQRLFEPGRSGGSKVSVNLREQISMAIGFGEPAGTDKRPNTRLYYAIQSDQLPFSSVALFFAM